MFIIVSQGSLIICQTLLTEQRGSLCFMILKEAGLLFSNIMCQGKQSRVVLILHAQSASFFLNLNSICFDWGWMKSFQILGPSQHTFCVSGHIIRDEWGAQGGYHQIFIWYLRFAAPETLFPEVPEVTRRGTACAANMSDTLPHFSLNHAESLKSRLKICQQLLDVLKWCTGRHSWFPDDES